MQSYNSVFAGFSVFSSVKMFAFSAGLQQLQPFAEKEKLQPFGWSFIWQRMKDSNPHIQSQSLLCYLYTNPLFMSRFRKQRT